jgi:TusA-related sulfurtransferase
MPERKVGDMQIDARDLFSPKPTVMTLEALTRLKKDETLAVLVNDGKAVDELMHLAEEQGCGFMLEDEGDYSVVTLSPTRQVKIDDPLQEALHLMGITPMTAPTILFGSDKLGSGNDMVGSILANEVIYDLALQEDLPGALVFYNSGAKLTMQDSPVLEQLVELEDLGVEILTDSVSAEAFGGEEHVGVGEVVDPYIVVALLTAQPGVMSL